MYITDRHPKDILRSFAHEMIHHMQNMQGRLGNIGTQNVNQDDNLKGLEESTNILTHHHVEQRISTTGTTNILEEKKIKFFW